MPIPARVCSHIRCPACWKRRKSRRWWTSSRTPAQLGKDAGFDGIEIQAANGYLIDNFLRDGSNKRDDAYGGTVDKRARLLREVVEAVAKTWAAERVGVHLSPLNSFNGMSDSDPAGHFTRIAQLLGAYGLSYLHVIEPASAQAVTPLIRQAFQGPLILSSGYNPRAGATGCDIEGWRSGRIRRSVHRQS